MSTNNKSARGLIRTRLTDRNLSVASVLKSRDGIEVSIPNIIVAIVVSLVVIASVVAGIVFIVPFAQNSSAQGDVQTVQSAEQVYYAQVAPPAFGTGPQLVAQKAILSSNKQVGISISATGDGYCAAALSQTGNVYYVTSGSSTVTSTAPSGASLPAGVTCPALAQITAGDLH